MAESPSILTSIKRTLSIPDDYDAFDPQLLTFINGTFSTLSQLGIGPPGGFRIDDATTHWDEYLEEDLRLNNVKTYMYLAVRLLFDPPQTAHAVTALSQQIDELVWRINVQREEEGWNEPPPRLDRRQLGRT